jgi:coenzyme F420-reducing hydrogenase beta subunit
MTAIRQGKKNISIFAARNIDEETRLLSSSGGMFSLFAVMILEKGGIVCGAAFDDRFDVHHCFAHDRKGLGSLRKSKYVKSRIGSAYQEIKKQLEEGVYVLFSGTPCETAGLKAYLGKEYERLLCIDVICHGAPDPRVWRGYLNALELKYGAAVSCVEFRKKNCSASHGKQADRYNVYMKIGDTEICGKDAYMQGFLGGLFLLPCCYGCRFKEFTSGADIQLGDFWGLHTIYPEFCERTDDGTPISDGTSEVIILTDKGRAAFEEIRSRTICFELNQKRFEYHKGFGNYEIYTSPSMRIKTGNAFSRRSKTRKPYRRN